MSLLALVVTLVLGMPQADARENDLAKRFEIGLDVPPALYEGRFAQPPVPHWRVRLPGGVMGSSVHTERTRPVVDGGHIFVGSAAAEALYQLDRRDGSVIRSYPASASVESEPVVVGDRVYFTDTGGSTWCYRQDGELIWRHQGKAPILVRPTLGGKLLYVTNVDDLAVALDVETGELQWRYQRPPDITRDTELALYAAPPAVLVDDEVVLGFSDGSVVSLDATTGEVRWERAVGEGRYPDLVAAPTAWRNDIFASGYFEPFVAIDRETRNVRWRLDYGAANAALLDTRAEEAVLYHPGTDGVLRAVVARTGEEVWAWDSETPGALTTPVATDAGLVVGSSDGQIYLVDASTGKLLWRYHEEVRLQGVTGMPSVSGRQLLFVTNAGYLHSMLSPRKSLFKAKKPYPAGE